jgi:hypothetical protein
MIGKGWLAPISEIDDTELVESVATNATRRDDTFWMLTNTLFFLLISILATVVGAGARTTDIELLRKRDRGGEVRVSEPVLLVHPVAFGHDPSQPRGDKTEIWYT